MKSIRFLLLLAALLLSKTGSSQSSAIKLDSLFTRSNQLGLFNGTVLILDGGKEVYRRAIGFSDASKTTRLTDQYRFHIGSIAKEFNATAIMILKEQGKLSLDDHLSRYFPELPSWAQTIRIRHLLQYSSGLPDLKWKFLTGDASAMDSVKMATRLDFAPGTQYAYNNTNTLLQRQLVERLTKMKFSEFVRQKMLVPLGMTASLPDPDERTPSMAISFNNEGVASPMTSSISGWTAVTPDDFLKWERQLERFTLISPASTRELLNAFAPGKQCGLGAGTMDGDRLITHIHDGTALNYQALLSANTVQGRVVILMTNNKQNSLYDLNKAVQNILDGKPYIQPKKTILTPLLDAMDKTDGAGLLALYQQFRTRYPADYAFDTESPLNSLGYTMLNKKRTDDAILIFEYNTRLFPQSGNVFDSLGEAWLAKGDRAKALLYYQRSFQLDPSNEGARTKIAELEGKN